MENLIYDIESNGLLLEVDQIHMLILTDILTGETKGYTDSGHKISPARMAASGSLDEGFARLAAASIRISFNGHDYDERLIEKLRPDFVSDGLHFDLRTHGTAIRPRDQLLGFDSRMAKREAFPRYMIGSESLKAWAIRAGGEQKSDYKGGWEALNDEMWDYGLQDGATTLAVYRWMTTRNRHIPWMTAWLEQEASRIIGRQKRNGWAIDVPAARELETAVAEDVHSATNAMSEAFGAWFRLDKAKANGWLFQGNKGGWRAFTKLETPEGLFVKAGYTGYPVTIPKRTAKRVFATVVIGEVETKLRAEYTAGAPYTPIELHQFNPGARMDVYRGLNRKYGWEPNQRTDGGGPKVSEETLSELKKPEAVLAARHFKLEKIAGYVTKWLKKEKGGRLYGNVFPNRANTRRMTHADPNLAQVPGKTAEYGKECREIFIGDPGWMMVGADAAGLELRCLANALAPYDGGNYASELLEGDIHYLHLMAATGWSLDMCSDEQRSEGKTLTYAWLYGAGNGKLASAYADIPGTSRKSGKAVRLGYENGIDGAGDLLEDLRTEAGDTQTIRSLDGWKLWPRSDHSILNLRLQSDGALVMKAGLIFADELLTAQGLVEGKDFKYVGNIHDEVQCTASPTAAPQVGAALVEGIRKAGEWFGFELPLAAEAKYGKSWAETH